MELFFQTNTPPYHINEESILKDVTLTEEYILRFFHSSSLSPSPRSSYYTFFTALYCHLHRVVNTTLFSQLLLVTFTEESMLHLFHSSSLSTLPRGPCYAFSHLLLVTFTEESILHFFHSSSLSPLLRNTFVCFFHCSSLSPSLKSLD